MEAAQRAHEAIVQIKRVRKARRRERASARASRPSRPFPFLLLGVSVVLVLVALVLF